SNKNLQYEASVRYADGSVHQVMFYKGPIIDETDTVTGLVGALLDISERKRGEEALRESNQKLRLLTSLTRHDIFNQLNAVQILLNMAFESSDPEIIHRNISRAQEAGNQIEATIGFTREYEDFGTTSSGWQGLHKTIEAAQNQVTLGTIIIDNQIPVTLEIYADPIIRKVFTTLLENAFRHGGNVTLIKFFIFELDGAIIITCEDDGVGIPPAEKKLIFDHGYGKNTGIGLFLSREILSITGLSIRETGELEKGARFEIRVPEGKFRYTLTEHPR
ncbi:MAG: HAMP domain-containing sensor histidine kinase, partial [Methanobacteriota archaeon]